MMLTSMTAQLFNLVVNITVTFKIWVHHLLVGCFKLTGLSLVFQDVTALFPQSLLRLFVQFPLLLVRMRVEEGLDLVVMVIQLELLLAHVDVAGAELGKLFICISLLLIDVALLVRKGLLVLPQAIVLLGRLIELLVMMRRVAVVVLGLMMIMFMLMMLMMLLIPVLELFKVLLRESHLKPSLSVLCRQ